MRTAATPQVEAPVTTLWRCGGRDCGAGEWEHDENALYRHVSEVGRPDRAQIAGGRRVSRATDAWEVEAERVSRSIDQVGNLIEIHGTGSVLGVHRCGDVPTESCPCHDSPEVGDVLRSSGSPLDTPTRRLMEERLDHDFSSVRIHADEVAAGSAAALDANAYTVGNHVAFARGRYAPSYSAGRRLLAHELTHVVQQDRSGGSASVGLHRQSSAVSPSLPPPTAASSACTITFAHNSTRAVNAVELDGCVQLAQAYVAAGGDRRVAVHGFASEEGEIGPNTALSLRRAERVRDLLVHVGVPTGQIDVAGHGEDTTRPTLEGNRRVEVVLTESITFPPENITVAPTVAPTPRGFDTEDCSTAQTNDLRTALPVARAMVNKARRVLGRARTPEVDTLMRKYFIDASTSTRLHALIGYMALKRGIDGNFTFECEDSCDNAYAYVYRMWSDVHICPQAFGRSTNELARTIVHESSHKFDSTDDEQYCYTGCNSIDRWDAYDNADSYARFAWEAYTTLP